ncbi:NAD(P)/FAD-dependent oxidoreductase [Pseudomaricurvus alkylphenolicus]|jgi:phytoene dehydrogenase-like protein|uniref:phytoene desaturase family protein n=1 Tax=Pseudomaricurvus alkylphenolicus TaxID=1306991 RepID=UPI0014221276|nr:NAD(P)/FAD-dependent oxidoreductase [Pseudomaricurvus alkylphenolicus]NIB38855.1 NAD(P)/FAD-dependent oxidoreductase [Pseudomaricurvus alkylphenolicus]
MSKQYDMVVVGGGSNSLVAAAYMAKAGKSVLVLEKNDQCGGGVVSIEIAPGFINDPHASGYYVCMANPAISHDELGLFAKHGLEFKYWKAGFATIFSDGSHITAYSDLDKTCEDIAKFSQKDAQTYREFAQDCAELLPLLSRGFSTPPMPTGNFMTMLESSVLGRKLAASMFMSVYEMLDHMYESPEVKIHIMKWCAEMMEGPDIKGTGVVLYQLFGLAHTYDAAIPVGGSREVTNALLRCIEYHGGEIRTEAEVTGFKIVSGDVKGVYVGDELIEARDAVIANIHPWRLQDFIPEVDPDVAASARMVHLSNHGAVNQQFALTEPPRLKAGKQFDEALCVEFVEKDVEACRRVFDEYRYGYIPKHHLSPLTMINSNLDPSRAPEGQATMYLYHFAPRELADGGLEAWARPENREGFADAVLENYKQYTTNIDSSKIIARHIETPLEHHRHSMNMMHGDIYGIGTTVGQLMGRRPTPELSQYQVPGISSLYLAGPIQHPGGTVTFGGRATAMRMAMDMDMNLKSIFEAH